MGSNLIPYFNWLVFLKKQRLSLSVLWFHLLGCLVAGFTLTASAVELPDIGDSSGTVISPEKERQLGAAFVRQLQGSGAIMEDPETLAYLQSIGSKLVLHSDGAGYDYTFFPIASAGINAFAAPGGYIGINAGLILNTHSESELAGVLAHEISHVTQRHLARAYERAGQMSIPVAVAMIGSLLLGAASPDAGIAAFTAVQAGSVQDQIDFTRANEQEADRVGMGVLSRAEFDPEGMPSFFERLQLANRLTDPKYLPEYLRTHPVTVSRISDSKNRLVQYPQRDHEDSEAYQLTRVRMIVAAAKNAREAVKIFEGRIKEGDLENESVTRYGYALALIRATQYKKARQQLQNLLKNDPENSSFLLASASVETGEGNYKKGLQIYQHLNSLYPGYRPVVMNYAKALLQVDQFKSARELLLDYGLQHGPDRTYYGLLAEAEGRSGAQVEAHLALAEYHYLGGETERARDQLKIAERSTNLDYYHKQRLAIRLEQFEKELEEEKELHKR